MLDIQLPVARQTIRCYIPARGLLIFEGETMIRVVHLPYWAESKRTGRAWLLCVAGRAMRSFASKESAEIAAQKLAAITGATLEPLK